MGCESGAKLGYFDEVKRQNRMIAWTVVFFVSLMITFVITQNIYYDRGYQDAYNSYKENTIDKPENIKYLINYEKLLIDKKYSKP